MEYKAGDVVVAETNSFQAWFTKRIQKKSGYTDTESLGTHVAIIINENGDLLEATGRGIRYSNVKNYLLSGTKIHILRNKDPKVEAVAYMAIELSHIDNLFKKYDNKLILGLVLYSIGLPAKVLTVLNNKNQYICTEYVITCFEKCGIIVPKTDKLYWPAEFLRWTKEGFFKEVFYG